MADVIRIKVQTSKPVKHLLRKPVVKIPARVISALIVYGD